MATQSLKLAPCMCQTWTGRSPPVRAAAAVSGRRAPMAHPDTRMCCMHARRGAHADDADAQRPRRGLWQLRPALSVQGDRPLNIPMEDLIVYEAHVRGFTADPTSGVDAPGSYLGMADRLDYLQVLPVHARSGGGTSRVPAPVF